MANKKGMSLGKRVMIGAGVAAVGAGAYYLLGPDGKKNQKKAKAWMAKMKKEHAGEIKSFSNQLKSEWKANKKTAKPAIKQAKKSVKKEIRLVKKLATKKRR